MWAQVKSLITQSFVDPMVPYMSRVGWSSDDGYNESPTWVTTSALPCSWGVPKSALTRAPALNVSKHLHNNYRVPRKSVTPRVFHKSVTPRVFQKVSHRSVLQEFFLTRVSLKRVLQECHTKIVFQEWHTKSFPTRMSDKSVPTECHTKSLVQGFGHLDSCPASCLLGGL